MSEIHTEQRQVFSSDEPHAIVGELRGHSSKSRLESVPNVKVVLQYRHCITSIIALYSSSSLLNTILGSERHLNRYKLYGMHIIVHVSAIILE